MAQSEETVNEWTGCFSFVEAPVSAVELKVATLRQEPGTSTNESARVVRVQFRGIK